MLCVIHNISRKMNLNTFIPRQKAHKKSKALVGGKGFALAQLSHAGFPVPDFFLVTTKARNKKKGFVTSLQHFLHKKTWIISGRNPVAARSSAPIEDSAMSSFAGQLDTILNIRSFDELCQSIYHIWDSPQRQNVQHYIKRFSLTKTDDIAVIVQKMVQADFSGVVFTSHPLTNDHSSMLVEIVRGAGENLVSGKKTPVSLWINKENKSVQNCPEQIDEDISTFVNSFLFQELFELVISIENHFELPQDIEWSVENGTLWILQSRPITTIYSRIKTDASGQAWTDYFFAERFVKTLSPLGWSIIKKWVLKNAFIEPLWYLGYDYRYQQEKSAKLIHGKPHVRLDLFHHLYESVPSNFISSDKKLALNLSYSSTHWLTALLRSLPAMLSRMVFYDLQWFPLTNLRTWRRFSKWLPFKLDSLKNQMKAKDSLENYKRVFTETESLTDSFLSIHRWSITFADIFASLLQKFLNSLAPATQGVDVIDLLSGLEDNITVKTNMALRASNNRTELLKVINKYGYRSESLDIAQPTWSEETLQIERLWSALKRNKKSRIGSLQKRRQQAERECKLQLKNTFFLIKPFALALYKVLLHFGQEFALLRENQRDSWHKILAVMRKSVMLSGRKLEAHGVLEDANDIFYLNRTELLQTLSGAIKPAQFLIEKRKNNSRHQPEESLQQLESTKQHQRYADYNTNSFTGIGVSRGHVIGKVHISRSYQEAFEAQEGDILVAHTADPAWSPVFGLISGLVMETGGVLSHASILAREFGVPTVTSVNHATELFQNGDMVEIDGERGIIKRIKEESVN